MKIDKMKLNIAIANSGMKLINIAEKTGLSYVTIRKTRTGERNPTPATIGKIAKALNVPVEQIIEIGGDGNGTV